MARVDTTCVYVCVWRCVAQEVRTTVHYYIQRCPRGEQLFQTRVDAVLQDFQVHRQRLDIAQRMMSEGQVETAAAVAAAATADMSR
jgi:hypothetical protein